MKRIVCIEDEQAIIELIRLMLADSPVEIVGALGGEDGLEAVRRLKPDLVLLDIMMPQMDGWSVYQAIRADPELRDTRIIVVTATLRQFQKPRLLADTDIDDLIVKPFGAAELRDSINRLLGLKA